MKQGSDHRANRVTSLWEAVPDTLADKEFTEILASGKDVRVERIVSKGHSSPDHFWYDSDQAEWVALLSGEAKLRFKEQDVQIHMKPGDHLTIAPHQEHRIEWTTPDQPSVWLAVYFSVPPQATES